LDHGAASPQPDDAFQRGAHSFGVRSSGIPKRCPEISDATPEEKTGWAVALYDALDLQRATQAYIWALPAVGFHGLPKLITFGAQDGIRDHLSCWAFWSRLGRAFRCNAEDSGSSENVVIRIVLFLEDFVLRHSGTRQEFPCR